LQSLPIEDTINLLILSGATNIDNVIYLYLKSLCELYRRRFKFSTIIKQQSFPQSNQIAPRILLEFGDCAGSLLIAWMNWRKWAFDIDNRCAQETGYLFESLVASCLGGVSVSHHNSPVKRISDNGTLSSDGRQVDCYIEELSEVYELKLRVTAAASGQGRFAEEMRFPLEAYFLPPLIAIPRSRIIGETERRKQQI
jgi:hypothetical protein